MNEYEEIAYEKLGLSPRGHELGTTRLIELPPNVLYSICARRLNNVDGDFYRQPEELDRDWCAKLAERYFLLYPQYLDILKSIRSFEPRPWETPDLTYKERRDGIVECEFKYGLYERGKYEPTLAGWKKYLRDASPIFYEYIQREISIRIPREKLHHAYIVAGSQSGKTELLKLFTHSICTKGNEAIVFIEPAGHASRQIARWKVHRDRLVYVDHALQDGVAPVVNPFEIFGISANDTSPRALRVKKVIAQELLGAFQEVLATGEGAELSKNMQTVLMQCLLVLLDFPKATIRDLLRFMDGQRNGDLVAFGQSRAHYRDVADFFTYSFDRRNLDITKTAIQTKLQDLFSTGNFADLTCGKSTIDLERAIEQKKVVVFNLSKGSIGEREGSAFGRLIVAMLQGIAMRREAQGNPVPVRVIIDEAHNYTTKSMQAIITEAAKYKLFLTMAQQQVGQGMTTEMRNAVLNTSAQIGGRNAPSFYSPVASMLNVGPEDIEGLALGEFIIHLSGVKPFKFRLHTHLLGWKQCMGDREWERVKAEQIQRYYRPIEQPQLPPPARQLPSPVRQLPAPRQQLPAPERAQPSAVRHVEGGNPSAQETAA